jgi:uncharacterized membrane protein
MFASRLMIVVVILAILQPTVALDKNQKILIGVLVSILGQTPICLMIIAFYQIYKRCSGSCSKKKQYLEEIHV